MPPETKPVDKDPLLFFLSVRKSAIKASAPVSFSTWSVDTVCWSWSEMASAKLSKTFFFHQSFRGVAETECQLTLHLTCPLAVPGGYTPSRGGVSRYLNGGMVLLRRIFTLGQMTCL